MILTCPNCGTQYVVKDGAIPPGGRQVRCASCKHSWHQDPENDGEGSTASAEAVDSSPAAYAEEPGAAAPPVSAEAFPNAVEAPEDAAGADDRADDEEESLAEATLIEPRSGPEAEQRAYEEAVIASEPEEAAAAEAAQTAEADDYESGSSDAAPETANHAPRATELVADFDGSHGHQASRDDEFSPFADRDVPASRRRSPILAIAILVVVIAALAAAFWFLAPTEWKAGVGLGDAGKTPLELMITHPDRQKLASGQESLTVTGRVINPTDATHAIPPIYAQLKSRTGKTIYSWTIAPPAPSLGPRASTSFNSTEVDVPPGGDDLTITLGAPKP